MPYIYFIAVQFVWLLVQDHLFIYLFFPGTCSISNPEFQAPDMKCYLLQFLEVPYFCEVR